MGAGSNQDDSPADPLIAALVNEYFDRRQAGETVSAAQFSAEHPESEERLRPYLEGLTLVERARTADGAERTAAGGRPVDVPPTISGYDLLEEIGRGGMGVVYKALQVTTKRVVAVKVMLAGPFASDTARRRFAREVQLAARLDTPGIVRVLESGTVAGQPYYAMDYVAGVGLTRYWAEAEPDRAAVLRLFIHICQAVEYAHRQGVVHRDLKPANVLVDREGRPHILDFGLAKAIDLTEEDQATYHSTLSTPGQVMGTLAYLSPEQAGGNPVEIDARTDVYALGVMLFEALTGRSPVDLSGRPCEVLQRIVERPATLPARPSQRVDTDLETILLKALAKQKQDRYASAGELTGDLERYLAREPILARRPSRLYVARKMLRKHWLRIAGGAAALAVVVAALWGGVWWSQRQRSVREAREWADARLEALRAQQSLDVNDVKVAASIAESLCTRYPSLPEAQLVVAKVRLYGREADSAIVVLERYPPGSPGCWAAQELLADVYRNLGNSARADAVLGARTCEMPDTAEAWYLRSFATLRGQDAAEYARQAVARDPDHALAWSRLAYLEMRLGQLEGAQEAADQLIRLNPGASAPRVLKGDILVRRHQFKQAVAVYAQVLHADPNLAVGHLRRALAYRCLKRYNEAIADYEPLLARESRPAAVSVWYRFQRATDLWMAGRAEDAAADCEWVRSLLGHPGYADARRFLILNELGRGAEAEAVLKAAARDADDPWLAKVLACLAGQLPAEELVQAADPNHPEQLCEACYYGGETCLLRREAATARDWFQRCVETGVEFDPHTIQLAPMNEYDLASWRLDRLAVHTVPASQP